MLHEKKGMLLLQVYDSLTKREHLNRSEFCQEHGISLPTFYRYLADIRAFLMENHPNYILVFDSSEQAYYLREGLH